MTILELLQGITDNSLYKHKCKNCSCVWEHNRAELVREDKFEEGHRCPVCSREEYNIFDGTGGINGTHA